jgi:RNA polymerase sigma factor (sigma-70 family)
MTCNDDLELVRRALACDKLALGQLGLRLGAAQRWLAFRNARRGHLLAPADLEDVRQDSLLRVLSGLGKYRGEASLETWIRRVCDLTYADALRKRFIRAPLEPIEEHSHGLAVEGCQSERAELRAALLQLTQELSKDDLRVVRLHAEAGVSFERIAQLMGTNAGGVKARYYRAMARLRTRLVD